MTVVRLAEDAGFEAWRDAARALRLRGIPPERTAWAAGAENDLFENEGAAAVSTPACAFKVPRAFIDLAQDIILHRDPRRFMLLYRLLWRLQEQPALLRYASDPDVAEGRAMAKAVGRAAYQMQQYVRFRRLAGVEPETYAAWIEPEHRVVERSAPFFVDRFANLRWSILTPDRCAHWDGAELVFSEGAPRSAAPGDDALEDLWRGYFSSVFNPARLKVKAMTTQMPKHLWRNLPEAEIIPSLIRQANTRTEAMVASQPSEPSRRALKAVARAARDAPFEGTFVPSTVKEVWPAVNACRRCDLWRNATQGVAGEGPARAALMLVGEQPGDQEDLVGKPFVGPAGQLLDKALAEAGVPREDCYVTNAVKHFKFEPRGKRRIHAKPNAGEIKACRWWLDHERRLVKPRVIVALGATAGTAVFGRPVKVMHDRGRPIDLDGGGQGMVTVHPSYLLRVPDEAEKARAYKLFVQDLKAAWALV